MTDSPRVPVRISEEDLIMAHSTLLARPCACGGVVIADPRYPSAGVLEHQDDNWHQEWVREWIDV